MWWNISSKILLVTSTLVYGLFYCVLQVLSNLYSRDYLSYQLFENIAVVIVYWIIPIFTVALLVYSVVRTKKIGGDRWLYTLPWIPCIMALFNATLFISLGNNSENNWGIIEVVLVFYSFIIAVVTTAILLLIGRWRHKHSAKN